jgi:hypothetical protein
MERYENEDCVWCGSGRTIGAVHDERGVEWAYCVRHAADAREMIEAEGDG